MAFNQPSGPPASAKQVKDLLELLIAAGHTDFRDARGPMGFSQRQANGKFTRDEADAFIARLQDDAHGSGEAISAPDTPAPRKPSPAERSLKKVSSEALAAELQSRGWIVVEP